MPTELVTVPAVPIVRTGTYELSTGTRTFAEEDLRAAADAFANDPGVLAPRIKIDSVAEALGLDPTAHGGEPAFGWADNLTVSANGQELVADLHVPSWIHEAMTWAYPSLSIEGTAPGWESSTGRTHEFVVTAVALLGVHWPGVTTLDDFRELLANGPDHDLAQAAPEQEVLATMPQRARPVAASLDSDLVARRFYDGLDSGAIELPEGVTAWAVWIRSMRFDDSGTPYLKVTDEDSGTLYRVDFTVAGSEVTFGGFVEVVEQDVPVAAGAARPAPPLATWATRTDARAVAASTQEATVPIDVPALRERLGLSAEQLPDDATEEQINAALSAEPEPTPPEPEPEAEPAAPTPEQVAASGGRVIAVSREQWEGQQRDLAALRASDASRTAAEQRAHRDALVNAALADGRIAPAEAGMERDDAGNLPPGWRRELDEAPEATERLLATLTPNRVPVTERGEQPSPEAVQSAEADHDAYMARHFPQAHAATAARRGQGVRHRQEV
jgi:hypothetical protein